MPVYRIEAVDATGRLHKDLVDADSERAARAQLRSRQWIPLKVVAVGQGKGDTSEAAAGPGSAWLKPRRAFTQAGLTVWTRQLSGLVSAGLPLERALVALADEARSDRQRELLAMLRSEVNGGAPFAQALAGAPADFDPIYRSVVSAGEQTGALGRVLERLADDLEGRQALRAKLLSATLYPAIVSVLALVIVGFLLTYVVPQVAGVFAGSRRALPTLTVFMLGLSEFFRHHGLLLLLGAAAGAAGLVAARRVPHLRLAMDSAWLRLPLVGRLAAGYNGARFAATLAMLAAAGVPILKALQAAADTLSNQALKDDAQQALVQVREGAPLGSALAAKPRFPPLLSMFARLGEQTGSLPTMLQRAAEQLSGEVQRRSMALATVLEPLLIVGMGGIVMVIVLAVLLPIIELNTWVR